LLQVSLGPVDDGDLDIFSDKERTEYYNSRKVGLNWFINQASAKEMTIYLNITDPTSIAKLFDEKVTILADFKDFEPNFPEQLTVEIPKQKQSKTKEVLE
jgi:hypothetical protein